MTTTKTVTGENYVLSKFSIQCRVSKT